MSIFQEEKLENHWSKYNVPIYFSEGCGDSQPPLYQISQLFIRCVSLQMDISPSSRMSLLTWEIRSDVTSYRNCYDKLPTLFCFFIKTKNQAQMHYQRRKNFIVLKKFLMTRLGTQAIFKDAGQWWIDIEHKEQIIIMLWIRL